MKKMSRNFRTTAVGILVVGLLGGLPGLGGASIEGLESADQAFASGEVERALSMYEDLARQNPLAADVFVRIALASLQVGNAERALEAAAKAQELDMDSPEVYLVLAQAQAGVGQPLDGVATLEQGLQRFPENIELLESLATINIARERWKDASGILRQLIRLDPDGAVYRIDLARVLISANDLGGASQVLHEARAQGVDVALVHALQGKVALLAGKHAEARKHFEASLASKENAEALGGLGALAFVAGDLTEAIGRFESAVALAPGDPDLHFNRGNALMQAKQVERAEKSYRQSLSIDGNNAAALLNLGVIVLNRLAVAEARALFRRASDLDPRLPGPRLHLARIAAAQYRYADARRHYEAYQDLVPDIEESMRVDEIIANIDTKVEASAAARARGEIHLLQLRTTTQEEAQALIARVKRGEDFYTLAETETEFGGRGGTDAGFVDPNAIDERFSNAVRSLEVGAMTPPLAGPTGFAVFLRVE